MSRSERNHVYRAAVGAGWDVDKASTPTTHVYVKPLYRVVVHFTGAGEVRSAVATRVGRGGSAHSAGVVPPSLVDGVFVVLSWLRSLEG